MRRCRNMGYFLYFMQLENRVNIEGKIREIFPQLEDVAISMRDVNAFADNKAGVVFSQYLDHRNNYLPNEQIWKKYGNFHVGYYKNDMPKEIDLRKKNIIEGHLVKLGNSEMFIIPVARLITGGSRFPYKIGFDENLTPELKIVEKYQSLYDIAQKVWDAFVDSVENKKDTVNLTLDDQINQCASILGVNYYVGKAEIDLLNLFDTQNIAEIWRAMIDLPSLQMINEKKNLNQQQGV